MDERTQPRVTVIGEVIERHMMLSAFWASGAQPVYETVPGGARARFAPLRRCQLHQAGRL